MRLRGGKHAFKVEEHAIKGVEHGDKIGEQAIKVRGTITLM